MSLMGQIQTWFMGQATTGLKEEVTTLESLKSSLQTFFTRDNYSEVSHCNRFTLTIASGFLCPKCSLHSFNDVFTLSGTRTGTET